MKKTLVVCAALLLSAATAGAWYGHRRIEALTALPDSAADAERALALPGLVALVTVNVSALVDLEIGLHGAPEGELLEAAYEDEAADSWPARLERAGVDLSRDVAHVTAAAYARETGAGVVLGFFGDLPLDGIEGALRNGDEFRVVDGGEPLLLAVIDRETCVESGPYAVDLAPGRVLVGDPRLVAEAVARLDAGARAPGIERFQAFREDKIVGAALYIPDETGMALLATSLGNPIVAMAASSATEKTRDLRSLYLGAGVSLLPLGAKLESVVEADGADTASQLAGDWSQALDASRDAWAEKLPTAAALVDGLDVDAEDAEVRLAARVDRETLEQLQNLPGELLGLAFSGFAGGAFAVAQTGGSPEERLDENPFTFLAEQSVEGLAPYDPSAAFAGSADVVSGPFGIRMASLAVGEVPEEGPALAIEAVSTGIPNLGDGAERLHLFVTSIAGRGGEELLLEQTCGLERNELPAAFASTFGRELRSATKRVRLRPEARLSEVAHVAGHVRLRMPVHTEAVRLGGSDRGATLTRGGAKLEITEASDSSISWHLSGSTRQLLHLRALNAEGKPLMRQGSSEMDSFFGGGRSGSFDFAGHIEDVEAVFATGEEVWEFPFTLTNLRPGTDGETLASDTLNFFEFPLAQLEAKLAKAVEEIVGVDAPVATTTTGPFRVSLERIWGFGGLMPHFRIQAPKVPNLEKSLNGVELQLDEIVLRDGTVHRPPAAASEEYVWSAQLDLGGWSEDELIATPDLRTGAPGTAADVASLSGALVVRLPRTVGRLPLGVSLGSRASARGVTVVLTELGRDRFTLRAPAGGERVLAVRAYNAAGEQLWVPNAKPSKTATGWMGEFQVKGQPTRLEVIVATTLETARYPFRLEPDSTENARGRDAADRVIGLAASGT